MRKVKSREASKDLDFDSRITFDETCEASDDERDRHGDVI